jgi:hypothetical protein
MMRNHSDHTTHFRFSNNTPQFTTVNEIKMVMNAFSPNANFAELNKNKAVATKHKVY